MGISFLWDLVKQEKDFLYYVLIIVVVAVLYTAGPVLLGQIVDVATSNNKDSNALIMAGAFFAVVSVTRLFLNYASMKLSEKIFASISIKTANFFYKRALKKDISFVLDAGSGQISHKINNSYMECTALISTCVNKLFLFSVLFLGHLAVIFYFLPSLGFIILSILAVYSLIFVPMSKKLKEKLKEYYAAKDSMFNFVTDTIANILLVKSFSSEKAEDKHLSELSLEAYDKNVDYGYFKAFNMSCQSISRTVIVVITVCYCGHLISIGELSVATFFIVYSLAMNTNFFLISIIEGIGTYYSKLGVLENTLELLDENSQEKDRGDKLEFNGGDIEFKDVSFAYDKAEENTLESFNLSIKNKEKIGIAGESGAGKSTLISLLQGFYKPISGDITYNNQSFDCLDVESIRSNISYIPQDPSLFSRSIYDNIAYAKPDASKHEVMRAAKLANAHEFITKLPNGYGETVGERGFKLSGGQKQRIAIAQAILKDAPILIMDEATSALDYNSEKLIQESLQNLLKDKTCIVIAHRLSTIKAMDRILVLEEGEIAEEGSHDSLIERNGRYKGLWDIQMEGVAPELAKTA